MQIRIPNCAISGDDPVMAGDEGGHREGKKEKEERCERGIRNGSC